MVSHKCLLWYVYKYCSCIRGLDEIVLCCWHVERTSNLKCEIKSTLYLILKLNKVKSTPFLQFILMCLQMAKFRYDNCRLVSNVHHKQQTVPSGQSEYRRLFERMNPLPNHFRRCDKRCKSPVYIMLKWKYFLTFDGNKHSVYIYIYIGDLLNKIGNHWNSTIGTHILKEDCAA